MTPSSLQCSAVPSSRVVCGAPQNRWNQAGATSLGLLWAVLVLVVWAALAQGEEETTWWTKEHESASKLIDAATLRGFVERLAADELKGRDTPSRGLDLAAAYLAEQLQSLGLKPAALDSGYRQEIELKGSTWPDDFTGRIRLGRDYPLTSGNTVAVSRHPGPAIHWDGVPLEWIGAIDQLPRSQVENNTVGVILLEGSPAQSPALEQLGFMASRLGLRGMLLVLAAGEELSEQRFRAAQQIGDFQVDAKQRLPSVPILVIHHPKLSTALQKSGTAASGKSERRRGHIEFQAGPARPVLRETANIAARLLADAESPTAHETIVISAHYDHIGLELFGQNGDLICNGADDNASGSAALLGLAHAFVELDAAPDRSLLFLWFCGEEKGLLGSQHYTRQPLVSLEQTVANVNLEMLGRPEGLGQQRCWVTGYQFSDVGRILGAGGEITGVEMFRHDKFSDLLFEHSDNMSFARLGIPAHSVAAGLLHSDYHQPSDEADRIDFDNLAAVTRALFAGLVHMAGRAEAPAWNLEEPRARQLSKGRP